MHPYQFQCMVMVHPEFRGLRARVVIVFHLVIHISSSLGDLVLGVQILVI